MKKILVLTAALVLVASSSFATCIGSSNGKLKFGASVGSDALGVTGIGLSPKVVATYCPDSSATDKITSQWYAIGTVHPGGDMAYGTAQNVNNIFHIPYTTGDATATVLGTVPSDKSSESAWTNANWKAD